MLYVFLLASGRAKRPKYANRSHRWTLRASNTRQNDENNSSTSDPRRRRSIQYSQKRATHGSNSFVCSSNVRQPSSTTSRGRLLRVRQTPTVTKVPCLALLKDQSRRRKESKGRYLVEKGALGPATPQRRKRLVTPFSGCSRTNYTPRLQRMPRIVQYVVEGRLVCNSSVSQAPPRRRLRPLTAHIWRELYLRNTAS